MFEPSTTFRKDVKSFLDKRCKKCKGLIPLTIRSRDFCSAKCREASAKSKKRSKTKG